MKILLYSHAFDPSLGGVETVSRTLADGFHARGLACKVVTQSPGPGSALPYEVLRHPGRESIRALLQWCDVVLFNGASLALQPWLLLSRKPFVWVHVGYQATSIDGAGWVDGAPSPLTPWASFVFHTRRSGLASGLRDGVKLLLRRTVAKHLVARNVAITRWMERALPLPRQVQIYNPFPIDQFRAAQGTVGEYAFFYLGRLVQEKGIDTLLRAFASVRQRSSADPTLVLIGDGSARSELERLAQQLALGESVVFAGKQSGNELVAWVARGRIGVLPSVWYEPMGGVAVELLAAGKPLIVTERGGLAECVADAGLVFPNGDHAALADKMLALLGNETMQQQLRERAVQRAQDFAPQPLIDEYVQLLQTLAAPR